ncbi:MAG: SU10 major capsid protein, partial [Candidatus Hodarchaeales archaeon]
GILQAISKSTNTTAQTSGTVWSASIMKGLMKGNWDNNNGDVATDMYMGSWLKDITDDFTNKTGVISDGANTKEIISVVDVFETGFGKLRVHKHRYVTISGTDATARVLAIRPDKLRVAYLERPYVDKGLARAGGYDPRAVAGSMTLEVRNQDSNFWASGYKLD